LQKVLNFVQPITSISSSTNWWVGWPKRCRL